MNERIGIALAGFLGGVGPSLAELVSLCKHESVPALPFYIGAVVMGIMGMAIALIAKETIPWKAFTQGLGAPALFSSAATAATSVAVLMSPIPEAYAQVPDTMSSIERLIANESIVDTAVIMINAGDVEYDEKAPIGEMHTFSKDGVSGEFMIPDKDTVMIQLEVYDPVIRRSIIQGLLPMQKNLTQQFQPKLIIKELDK